MQNEKNIVKVRNMVSGIEEIFVIENFTEKGIWTENFDKNSDSH